MLAYDLWIHTLLGPLVTLITPWSMVDLECVDLPEFILLYHKIFTCPWFSSTSSCIIQSKATSVSIPLWDLLNFCMVVNMFHNFVSRWVSLGRVCSLAGMRINMDKSWCFGPMFLTLVWVWHSWNCWQQWDPKLPIPLLDKRIPYGTSMGSLWKVGSMWEWLSLGVPRSILVTISSSTDCWLWNLYNFRHP